MALPPLVREPGHAQQQIPPVEEGQRARVVEPMTVAARERRDRRGNPLRLGPRTDGVGDSTEGASGIPAEVADDASDEALREGAMADRFATVEHEASLHPDGPPTRS